MRKRNSFPPQFEMMNAISEENKKLMDELEKLKLENEKLYKENYRFKTKSHQLYLNNERMTEELRRSKELMRNNLRESKEEQNLLREQEKEQNFSEFQHYMQELKERLSETEESLKEEKQTSRKLKQQNESYLKEIIAFNEVINYKKEKYRTYQSQLYLLKKDIENFHKNYLISQQVVTSLRAENCHQKDKLHEYQKEYEKREQAIWGAFEKLNINYKKSILAKQKLIEKIRVKEGNISNLEDTCRILTNCQAENMKKLDETENKLKEKEKVNTLLKTQIKKFEGEVDRLQMENNYFQTKKEKGDEDISEWTKKYSYLEEEMHEKIREIQKLKKSLIKTIDREQSLRNEFRKLKKDNKPKKVRKELF
ncbi:hypothetical protein ACGTN9_09130 [Halobacillus sp. MO56]